MLDKFITYDDRHVAYCLSGQEVIYGHHSFAWNQTGSWLSLINNRNASPTNELSSQSSQKEWLKKSFIQNQSSLSLLKS